MPRNAIPSIHTLPLEEIIAEAIGTRVGTKGVETEYDRLVRREGRNSGFFCEATPDELALLRFRPRSLRNHRNRQGKVLIVPGHDGTYGKITLFPEMKETEPSKEQLKLF